jgi:hypothetical protein
MSSSTFTVRAANRAILPVLWRAPNIGRAGQPTRPAGRVRDDRLPQRRAGRGNHGPHEAPQSDHHAQLCPPRQTRPDQTSPARPVRLVYDGDWKRKPRESLSEHHPAATFRREKQPDFQRDQHTPGSEWRSACDSAWKNDSIGRASKRFDTLWARVQALTAQVQTLTTRVAHPANHRRQ